MNIAQTARVATIAVLATALFTGCATGEPEAQPSSPAPSATETAEQPQAQTPEEIFTDHATNGQIDIAVLEVVDPRTFVVGPSASQQEENGLAGEITVAIRKDSTLVTPAAGECGYDELLAFAKQYFAANPESDAFVVAGTFASNEYSQAIVQAGFAYQPDPQEHLVIAQETAKNGRAGLWTTCPGFGAGRQ